MLRKLQAITIHNKVRYGLAVVLELGGRMKDNYVQRMQNGLGMASPMLSRTLSLAIILGIGAAAYARTDQSQSGSATTKTVKCCPIVVPTQPTCRSPIKPPSTTQPKSSDGSSDSYHKEEAEAKAKAEPRSEAPPKIRTADASRYRYEPLHRARYLARVRAHVMAWLWRRR